MTRAHHYLLLLTLSISFFAQTAEEPEELEQPAESAANTEVGNNDAIQEEKTLNTDQHYYLPNIPLKRSTSLLEHMRLFEREDEIVQLNTPKETFYGLYLPEGSGTPQGGVLILHDDQQHGHWPEIVAPIREYLPLYGWATLSIELPDIPARKRILRQLTRIEQPAAKNTATEADKNVDPIASTTDGESLGEEALTPEAQDNTGPSIDQAAKIEEDKDNDNEPALPRLKALPNLAAKPIIAPPITAELSLDAIQYYQQRNTQRIITAIEYLQSKGQFNLVVIGYGIGAAWAVDYIQQQVDVDKERKGLALITIDALASQYNPQQMNKQVAQLQVPFLDLVHPSQPYSLKHAKKRQTIMNRNRNNQYQQIITANMANYNDTESPTSRRIRGWLKTNAGGTLVKFKN